MRVLLADGDSSYTAMLATTLRREGYAVDVAPRCCDADYLLAVDSYDLLLFDDHLAGPPQHLCRKASHLPHVPVIVMISADATEARRIASLDAGADDCLTKVVGIRELLARLRALLRRQALPARADIIIGAITVNRTHRIVSCDGLPIDLTQKEFSILEYLALQAGRVVGRGELVSHVWDDNHDPGSRALDVHVSHLRAKLGPLGAPAIRAVRGEGYSCGE